MRIGANPKGIAGELGLNAACDLTQYGDAFQQQQRLKYASPYGDRELHFNKVHKKTNNS